MSDTVGSENSIPREQYRFRTQAGLKTIGESGDLVKS